MRGKVTEAQAPSVWDVIKMVSTRYREANARRSARKEVKELVSSTARGKPREEVRAQLLAEYARRGILPPPEPLFGNMVNLMVADDPGAKAELLREQREAMLGLAQLIGGELGNLRRLFSELQEGGDEDEEGEDE